LPIVPEINQSGCAGFLDEHTLSAGIMRHPGLSLRENGMVQMVTKRYGLVLAWLLVIAPALVSPAGGKSRLLPGYNGSPDVQKSAGIKKIPGEAS
jgi:hypothetical protein